MDFFLDEERQVRVQTDLGSSAPSEIQNPITREILLLIMRLNWSAVSSATTSGTPDVYRWYFKEDTSPYRKASDIAEEFFRTGKSYKGNRRVY